MLDDGVYVEFDNGWYYAHGIKEIGKEGDNLSTDRYSMWAWIEHMRHKRWWYPLLEEKFKNEVGKYLHE